MLGKQSKKAPIHPGEREGEKRTSGKAEAVTRSDIIHEIRTAIAIPKAHFSRMDASFRLIVSRLCWLVNWHRCWCCRRIHRRRIVRLWRRCCGACGGRNAALDGTARALKMDVSLSFGVWGYGMHVCKGVGWSLDHGHVLACSLSMRPILNV